ncbi:hypothetical protein WH95_03495 [Kiloniella litopenaei]|uniref:Uncharacterized protein n=1 Tax=Kiloniella litopenaei TaxID=1549748 RepID=A0A0M2RFN3_9PROT|nr:hypothetical protein [Kiloniella litopenaei]KKJ78368.1 hypothetical protein WH95_03495 [Kiloniella litopenaei]
MTTSDAELIRLNNNPLERVRSELIENEQLIWADRPVSERFYRKKIKAAIAGKVIIGLIALWILGVIFTSFSSGNLPALALVLFALPLAFIARKMLNKPNEARQRAEQTYYAITDKRLLIINDYKNKSIESYELDKLEFIESTENKDGTGDIYFTKTLITTISNNDRDGNSSQKKSVHEVKKGFQGIYDTAKVAAEINRQRLGK